MDSNNSLRMVSSIFCRKRGRERGSEGEREGGRKRGREGGREGGRDQPIGPVHKKDLSNRGRGLSDRRE